MRTGWKICGAAAAALTLAACASEPMPAAPARLPPPPPPRPTYVPPPPPAVMAPPVAARDRIRHAMELLGRGEPQPARAELTAALIDEPANPTARRLLEQIDRDPKAMLGERNFRYTIRAGESLSSLAQRFLGDPLLFYALARYNGIDAPDSAEVGQTLLIPGVPKPAAPAAAPPKAAVATPAPGANPARASALRRRALEDLSKGSVDMAVALLREAIPLDPGNTLIRGDLDRALRIQASLKKR